MLIEWMKSQREINKEGIFFSTLRPFKLMLSSECDFKKYKHFVLKDIPSLFISLSFFIRTISICFISFFISNIHVYIYIHIYKDVHKEKTSMSCLNLYFFSSILDAFRRYGQRQENEFLQGCMPFYSRFSSHVMLMRSHGLKLVM